MGFYPKILLYPCFLHVQGIPVFCLNRLYFGKDEILPAIDVTDYRSGRENWRKLQAVDSAIDVDVDDNGHERDEKQLSVTRNQFDILRTDLHTHGKETGEFDQQAFDFGATGGNKRAFVTVQGTTDDADAAVVHLGSDF